MSAARTGVDTARRSVLVDTADRDGVPVAYKCHAPDENQRDTSYFTDFQYRS